MNENAFVGCECAIDEIVKERKIGQQIRFAFVVAQTAEIDQLVGVLGWQIVANREHKADVALCKLFEISRRRVVRAEKEAFFDFVRIEISVLP